MSDRIAELEAALAAALERIDVLERSTGLAADPATPTVTVAEPVGPKAPRIDRRHLLTRGGTAAAGAVLGGVAATLATPGTAAAASTDGVFTSLEVDGTSALNGKVTVLADSTLDYGLVVGTAQNHTKGGLLGVGLAAGVVGNGIAGVNGEGSVYGMVADGGTYGLMTDGDQATILLRNPSFNTHPDPTSVAVAHDSGELYLSNDTDLWLCVAGGTPGTWRRVAGHQTAGALVVLATPTRVYDTRVNSGLPGAGTGPVTGVRHDIDLSGAVPVDATAALVTLTVTDTVANQAAYGQIYANGLVTPPSTSSINWTAADSLVATTTTTALTAGKVAISMNPGANVLIDVLGYYR